MTSAGLRRATSGCGGVRAVRATTERAGTEQAGTGQVWTRQVGVCQDDGPGRVSSAATPDPPAPRRAMRGVPRIGSAVCGVLGFEQQLGLGLALLGGVGGLIGSDHVGYVLRRRYADRARARLTRWQPKRRVHRWLIALLHLLVGDPRRLSASYRAFAVTNTVSAVVWGGAFVGVGYVLAARWHTGGTSWASPALAVAATGVLLGLAVTVGRRRRSVDTITDESTPTQTPPRQEISGSDARTSRRSRPR